MAENRWPTFPSLLPRGIALPISNSGENELTANAQRAQRKKWISFALFAPLRFKLFLNSLVLRLLLCFRGSFFFIGVGFQPLFEVLAHFVHLGESARAHIRLIRVQGDVVLVVILRRIKPIQGLERCNDGIVESLGIVELLNVSRGDFLLVLIRIENGGAILVAYVISLTILR